MNIDDSGKPKSIAIAAVCILVIGLAGLSTFRSCVGPEGERLNLVDGYGSIVAGEVATVIPPDARILVLQLEAPRNPTPAKQAAIFVQSMKKLGFSDIVTEPILGEMVSPTVMADGHTLSAEAFEQALKKRPDSDVVVSMAGTPSPSPQTLSFFSDDSAKLILGANVMAGADLDAWEQADALILIVLPRFYTPGNKMNRPPTNVRELFDIYFEVIKP